MKILMFGWEFPPHISGGLGTACYGLTKSLLNEGTELLFVVPRAHGDEEMNLISASEVFIVDHEKTTTTNYSLEELKHTGIQVIRVPSSIKPYSLAEKNESYGLEEWNYELSTKSYQKKRSVKLNPVQVKAKQYKFSGSYGPALLEEVKRYGEVAMVIAKTYSFNVIHAHDWLTYPAGISAKKVSGKPLIVHVHATEFDRAEEENIDSRVFAIEKEAFEKADRIVSVSQWTKQILMSKYGVAEKKITVVHNGVMSKAPMVLTPTRRLSGQIITFLGRVTYQKGPQYFIEAARKVLQRFPNAHFVMAGAGDLLPSMIERVANLRLSSRFHFTGFLKGIQLDKIWALSDLYVMPSVSEPFGIAPLEAMQSGVPVIISNQSGVAEVMPHAVKLDFWDVDGFANAICNVLSSKSLSITMNKRSKQTLKWITWDKAARKINRLYHEIIRKN